MQESSRRDALLSRAFGIAFGIATHALFAFTVWHLVWFLAGHAPATAAAASLDRVPLMTGRT